MSDIAERLRADGAMKGYYAAPAIQREAADEIEKLRAERRVMHGALMTIALHTEGAHPHRMSYMADLHRIARAALGEKQ